MYWLKPPPLARRIAAIVLIVAAFAWDLRSAATEPYPFTSSPIDRGQRIETAIEWRQVPVGLLPAHATSGRAAVDLPAGSPLLAMSVADAIDVPDGWWAIPIEAAAHASTGDTVMLIAADPYLDVEGLVTEGQQGDRFATGFRPALVAVPGSHAATIAAAALRGSLLVAVRPNTSGAVQGE